MGTSAVSSGRVALGVVVAAQRDPVAKTPQLVTMTFPLLTILQRAHLLVTGVLGLTRWLSRSSMTLRPQLTWVRQQ